MRHRVPNFGKTRIKESFTLRIEGEPQRCRNQQENEESPMNFVDLRGGFGGPRVGERERPSGSETVRETVEPSRGKMHGLK